ncbi:MAG: energy transducer TonB [Thiohalophilus sp.]
MTEPARFDVDHSNTQQADLPNQVRQRLQESLQLQLQYPEMARQRGWEGEVKVSVQLSGEGRIVDVALAQSSGHRILDENTLATLHNLPRLRWAPALLNGKGMKIELPVIYQLSRL